MVRMLIQKSNWIALNKIIKKRVRIPQSVFRAFFFLLVITTSGCVSPIAKPSHMTLEADMKKTAETIETDETTKTNDNINSSDVDNGSMSISEMTIISLILDRRHQTIEGFGTSGCWWAQDVGNWDEPVKNQISDWLFDKNKGIGLTQYRFNAGAGEVNRATDPWRRVETFEIAPGIYDWSRDAGFSGHDASCC